MTFEITNTAVILKAENAWDQQILDTIESRGVDKVQFEDSWNNSGGLKLIRPNENWGT